MCKICTVFYADIPCPEHTSRGAWSQKGVVFKENPGKKLCQDGKSKSHKKAILAKANITIEESIASKNNEDRAHASELYIGKLVQIVYFLPINNLAVKHLYPKFVEFLSSELQEPIIKQYPDTYAKSKKLQLKFHMRLAIHLFIHLTIIFQQNLMNVLKNVMTLLFMQTNPHHLQERKCLVFF